MEDGILGVEGGSYLKIGSAGSANNQFMSSYVHVVVNEKNKNKSYENGKMDEENFNLVAKDQSTELEMALRENEEDENDDDEFDYFGENQQTFMREAFKIFDKDNDGCLNEQDLK